ncbi:MAG TPA: glycosyltransferase family 2 protein, partial [Actinomycetota bacterium]|nr:glycosyltransferase family 2 protein [Actinomycetota bacterium]
MTASLRLPSAEQPLLSVVMVTYGGWDWPYRSLEAVVDHTDAAFEAICVDNASWDGTGDLLEELVDGATVVRNEENRGFAAAANDGARRARGDWLCFLNPDCLVRPGWLDPLIRAIEADPRAGAAIPRFLSTDGTVQEAGSAVDRQGWTHAFGRGADPEDPEHRFPRYVDYGSAACLLMRRETFLQMGGFEVAYYPAYCEDVDLCYRLEERGLRTVFEPRSDVVHAGAASTDEIRRARLIERNRRLLLERWGERLADRPALVELDARPHRLFALRDVTALDRLLVVNDRVPAPDHPLRVLLEVAARSRELRITLLCAAGEPTDIEDLLFRGIEVVLTADPGPWLDRRRFHYSAVLVAEPPEQEALDVLLNRFQPQALRRTTAETAGQPIPELLAS